jgi:hypothetical protein
MQDDNPLRRQPETVRRRPLRPVAAVEHGLSIGCLLAVFEKRAMGNRANVRVGLPHVESRRYEAANLGAEAKFQLISKCSYFAGIRSIVFKPRYQSRCPLPATPAHPRPIREQVRADAVGAALRARPHLSSVSAIRARLATDRKTTPVSSELEAQTHGRIDRRPLKEATRETVRHMRPHDAGISVEVFR